MPTRDARGKAMAKLSCAFVGDLHGNLDALEAVLVEMRARGIDKLVVVGDLLLPTPEGAWPAARPREVWFRLQEVGAKLVRGVSDTALYTVRPEALAPRDDAERRATARFLDTRRAVGDFVLARIAQLPERHRMPLPDGSEIVAVHGAPSDPTQEMSHDLDDAELMALVGDDPADFVICAGTHVPYLREIGEVRVINVGSAGAAPEGRVAHVTLLTATPETTSFEQISVAY